MGTPRHVYSSMRGSSPLIDLPHHMMIMSMVLNHRISLGNPLRCTEALPWLIRGRKSSGFTPFLTMSSTDNTTDSDTFSDTFNAPYEIQIIYIITALTAVQFYDIVITFDSEVSLIWSREISVVNVAFVTIRYMSLVAQVFNLVTFWGDFIFAIPFNFVSYTSDATSIVAMAAWGLFGCFRIWAVWGRHWFILLLALPFSMAPTAINIATEIIQCVTCDPAPPTLISNATIASRACAIIADAIIVVATVVKTRSMIPSLQSSNSSRSSSNRTIAGLLLRDGSIQFAVLFIVNLAALIMDTVPPIASFNPGFYFVTAFSSIVLCRLILNLRSFYERDEFTERSRQASIHFSNAVLGNIGAPLSYNSQDSQIYGSGRGRKDVDIPLHEIIRDPVATCSDEDAGSYSSPKAHSFPTTNRV